MTLKSGRERPKKKQHQVQNWAFEFRRQDGASFICVEDPHVSDLFSVLADVKPMIYCNVNEDRMEYVKRLGEFFGMECLIEAAQQEGRRSGPKSKTVFLAKRKGLVQQASKLWRNGSANIHNWEWSTALLGYPSCCVKYFQLWHGPYSSKSVQRGDVIARILANTKSGAPFSFQLNNIFNMSSRLRQRGADHLKSKQLNEINSPRPLHMYHIIPWHPCSYRCRKSAVAAGKIWALIEKLLPDFAEELRRFLSNPILYLGKWEFVVMEGTLKSPREIFYSAVLEPTSLLPRPYRLLIERGNFLRIEGGQILVFKDGRSIGNFRYGQPLILPFAADHP